MIRTLQKRFIITAMAAITVLLVVLLGTINALNIWRVNNETDNTLSILMKNEGLGLPGPHMLPEGEEHEGVSGIGDEGGKPGPEPERHNIFNPAISEDMAMAARFFMVRLNQEGEVVYTDISRISSVDEAAAQEYALKAAESGNMEGTMDNFEYRIADSENGQGRVVIFLNVSNNRRTILAVLFISIGIGCAGWLLMLLLVVGLSKRAIRPIAVNMEKQKQFVTDAGHEIKTPLAIILANTDAMELHNGESKWSRNIRTQTERLSGLMKNLLALSRMDEGNVMTAMTELDISGLVQETADTFKEPAALKHIQIITSIKGDLKLHANREQMVQLVSVLLDNAVKYSPENDSIELVLDGSQREIVLKCRNACHALPDVPADRLFDRFYRGDTARTQKSGGYGIGLSVARAIVEAHKGTIKAVYEKEDHITFTAVI